MKLLRLLVSKPVIMMSAIAALLFAVIAFNAFPADLYQLNFTIRFWNLSGWPDYRGFLEDRYQGFPLAWRFALLPGLFTKLPRLFLLPNLFALVVLCWSTRRHLRLNWATTIVATLCFPVALFAFASSMQDFFVGACVLSGALALFSPKTGVQDQPSRQSLLVGLLMLAIVANVKFQGFLQALLVLTLAVLFRLPLWKPGKLSSAFQEFLFNTRRLFASSRRTAILSLLLLVLVFFQPIANIYRFQSPFFPVRVLGLKGSEGSNITKIHYLPRVPILYNGFAFLSSSLEIDPILRSKPGIFFQRSVHMQNRPVSNDLPTDDFGNRWIITGGTFGVLYAFLLLILAVAVWKSRPLSGHPPMGASLSALQRRLLISVCLVIFFPQTLELRYYLYALMAPSVVAVTLPFERLRELARAAVVFALIYNLFFTVASPTYFWLRTKTWPSQVLSWNTLHNRPSEARCAEVLERFRELKTDPRRFDGRLYGENVLASLLCGF